MQPVRTPPEVSALLLLPEAAEAAATQTAAITASTHDSRSMVKKHSLGDRVELVTSSDQVTGWVTRLRDLEKYHTHMHTLELLPRGGEESHSAAATAAAAKAGRAAFIGLWLAVASGRSVGKDQCEDQPRLCAAYYGLAHSPRSTRSFGQITCHQRTYEAASLLITVRKEKAEITQLVREI